MLLKEASETYSRATTSKQGQPQARIDLSLPWRRIIVGVAVLCAGIACATLAVHWVRQRAALRTARLAAPAVSSLRLAPGATDTLLVSEEARQALCVRTAVVETAPPPEPLRLSGSLLFDSSRLVHVHTRFGGEVVAVATVTDAATGQERQLRFNDKVHKGQVLAVVWSKEVGEKKSDLVDALSKYWLDQANLNRLKRLEKGVVPERTILEAERAFEADQIEVERVERTLRSWRLTDEEIHAVKAEALRIHQGRADGAKNQEVERTWAEVDVRAPLDGIVCEKNVAIGDIIDTNLDIFKLADLRELAVLAHVYEEDIPALEALPADQRRWQITLKAEPDWPPIQGRFDTIGPVIDPDQHTGAVMGWVDNREGKLRAGQFITATIQLPASKDEVAVPVDAVIDRGAYSTVLVAEDSFGRRVSERKVKVARRGRDQIYIRTLLSSEDLAQGIQPLRVGQLVVTNGNIELSGVLADLRSQAASGNQQLTRAP